MGSAPEGTSVSINIVILVGGLDNASGFWTCWSSAHYKVPALTVRTQERQMDNLTEAV